uniref:Uncharacterized protein n=1 Tax=Plectus sambesii TaxID=2011161 RepID=A0A914WWE7_9BILA
MQQQSGACPYPSAVAASVANPMSHMVNDPSAFTRLAGLAAGFQRSLSGPAVGARGHPYFTYDNSLKTDASRGHHGFNMITPLESIQQYSARAAGAAASSPQQFPNSMLSVGGLKRDMPY